MSSVLTQFITGRLFTVEVYTVLFVIAFIAGLIIDV